MPRNLTLFAACALTLLFGLPGHSQDSPSLGDLARQAQKDKSNTPPKKVFTNEDLPSGSVLGSSGGGLGGSLDAGLGQSGGAAGSSKPGAAPSPLQAVERMEGLMNQLDSMDRATLVKNILQGVDTNFPGRSKWEERLYAAKQAYVSQGHDLAQKARQILAATDSLQGSHDANDPRVKQVSEQLKELVRDGVRADAAFQAVVLEGRDLASQAAPH
jgi:hypothetical protein